MQFFDHTFTDLNQNLAFDEALLLAAEQEITGESVRFWEWPEYAVVLGAGGSIAIDVNTAKCLEDDVAIARRSSGGGTVLLGKGCLLFSLVLNVDRHALLRELRSSYQWILNEVIVCLGLSGVATPAGISDLAIGLQKFSGNAQQRKSRFILHHGTILYDFDLQKIPEYLHTPERMPDYRNARSHDQFVQNIAMNPSNFKVALIERFAALEETNKELFTPLISDLIRDKYSEHEWIYRR